MTTTTKAPMDNITSDLADNRHWPAGDWTSSNWPTGNWSSTSYATTETFNTTEAGQIVNTSHNSFHTTVRNDVLEVGNNTQYILNGLIVLSTFTIVVNIVVLIMSKFANGGKSATFVFLRSLCMADMLIGMFGMFKCILLSNLQYRIINCFLPESLFLSASTVIFVTLFWLNVDTYLRLSKPLGKINCMDKHCVIISMVLLWNIGFIVGFAPLMGWNDEEFVCNLFQFYKLSYTAFLSSVWILSMIGSCYTHYFLNRTTKQILANSELVSPRSLEFMKYSQLTLTIRNDMISVIVCYVPFLSYLFYYYTNNHYRESEKANTNVIYFLPIFLSRSIISAFIHSYRTIRIQHVLHDLSKHMSIFRKWSHPNRPQDSNSNSIATLNTSATTPTIETPAGTSSGSNNNGHRKLCATDSAITIVEDDSDIEEAPNSLNLTQITPTSLNLTQL